jgi:uncharacterized membrane protein YgcG
VNGLRYDTLRHALFVATGRSPDPLYGQIVADHTFWDGYVDEHEVHAGITCDGCHAMPMQGLRWKCRICLRHDICNTCRLLAQSGQYVATVLSTCDFSLVNLPDEALYIRSSTVDTALVVATLQVMKDWEKHTLRAEKRKNIKAFIVTDEAARNCDLGIMSYWKAADWDRKDIHVEKHGTRVKARSVVKAFGETAGALDHVVDASFGIAGLSGTSGSNGVGSGHSGGGHSSGGGGDGGGGGGASV